MQRLEQREFVLRDVRVLRQVDRAVLPDHESLKRPSDGSISSAVTRAETPPVSSQVCSSRAVGLIWASRRSNWRFIDGIASSRPVGGSLVHLRIMAVEELPGNQLHGPRE